MPMPNINIEFKSLASTAIRRSGKGTVAVILKDSGATGAFVMRNTQEIPKGLSQDSKTYIERTMQGYINPPVKVLVYSLESEAEGVDDALDYFATQEFNYLVGPPDATSSEATAISEWVKAEWAADHLIMAVLPKTAADHEGIINFDADNIKVGEKTYTAAEYCGRIAGILAGTPMTMSCTYAPLPEVTDISRKTKEELDEAVDAGKLVLFYDGEKVKIGRGVNSLVTLTPDKGAAFQKIKVVETMIMIKKDIKKTASDTYIGKYSNSYDNKCLLISAIGDYFIGLETDGILETGSAVDVDIQKQTAYLRENGVDTDTMNEQQIKSANTGEKVFLAASIKILDAIEDISLDVSI